ncbi:hypothetical protein TorRG33x02_035150 [Trema orientale]|uniref:Uncharacterized protein n=1 Tax=Trema orientale TaxID=63057 RepID=A0A2P5FSY5_TREOI|nr:hypothetical protein TorRG33x02_035150 [Trema orientale]
MHLTNLRYTISSMLHRCLFVEGRVCYCACRVPSKSSKLCSTIYFRTVFVSAIDTMNFEVAHLITNTFISIYMRLVVEKKAISLIPEFRVSVWQKSFGRIPCFDLDSVTTC